MKRLLEYGSKFRILKGGKISLVSFVLLGTSTLLNAAPSGGVVTSGNATINQSGTVTNINQTTNKATINWNTFNVASNEVVNFNQPNKSSIALNRVIGNEKSVINGAINANGQVWLLNSSGVLFGKNASINTASLLATTSKLSDDDFNLGNYNLKNDSSESVVNLGTINISNEGYAVLTGKEVSNEGSITVVRGKVHLAGANDVSINLNENSLVNLKVDKGVLDALVKNSGSIKADGGEIYLTTNAVDELLKGVVNNTGHIEAQTLDDITGHIELFAHGGTIQTGGTIKAEDGFVETSGKYYDFLGADIKAGQWLIDPVNVTIDSSLSTAIEGALATGNVTITTDGGNTPDTSSGESGTDGNIYVNSAISWSANNTLTLDAYNDIFVNENITHTGSSLGGIIFLYGQGSANGGSSTYNIGSGKSVIADSIQWRKGSDLNSYRYAIVDNDIFIGTKYIELGMSYGNGGKFGSFRKPSLFFGRQSSSGIGMIGDADGFGVGDDLRIDYFLPGTPAEQFTVAYGDSYETNGKNFATDASGYELLGLNADNKLEMKLTTTLNSTLKIEQTFDLGLEDKYFNNNVVLTNEGSSAISNATFIRSFDPDNTVDMGGNYTTINTIEKLISSGDSSTVITAQSLTEDPYETLTGNQAKILYYTTSSDAKIGYGAQFFSGNPYNVESMITTANSLSKGDTNSDDEGIGIIFKYNSLAASESKLFSFFTSLDNRPLSDILNDLDSNANISTSKTPSGTKVPESVLTPIMNNIRTNVQLPKVEPIVAQPKINTISGKSFGLGKDSSVQLVSIAKEGEKLTPVTMEEVDKLMSEKQGKTSNNNNKKTNDVKLQSRVQLSERNSMFQLVNGGVKLPEGVTQEFYVLQKNSTKEEDNK